MPRRRNEEHDTPLYIKFRIASPVGEGKVSRNVTRDTRRSVDSVVGGGVDMMGIIYGVNFSANEALAGGDQRAP